MKNSENEGSVELVVIGVIAALILVLAFPLMLANNKVIASQVEQQQLR